LLLAARRQQGDLALDVFKIRGFIARARATGAVLRADSDRKAAQGILDFWCTELASSPKAKPEDYEPVLLAAFVDDSAAPAPPVGEAAKKEEQRSAEAIRFAATARLWRDSGRQNGLLALDKASITAAKKYRDLDLDIAEWVTASEMGLKIRNLKFFGGLSIIALLAVVLGFVFNSYTQSVQKVDTLRKEVVKLDTKLNIETNQPASPQLAREDRSIGFIWIGSEAPGTNKLLTLNSKTPVFARDVKPGETYLTNRNLVFRKTPPTRDENYASTESLGVLPAGSKVKALQAPEAPYVRPSGNQYWLKVESELSDTPIVYMQYTDASVADAEAFAAVLREKGYRIPGVEATDLAKGLNVVRYFYSDDRVAAEKLSKDVAASLATLKYSNALPAKVEDLTNNRGRRNYPGVIEFWIDVPARP
jgi:hypothetical protein